LAALHDVLVALGILTFAGYEITLNVIAALLTLVGYSVNDTIVIFDRARENLRQRKKLSMTELLNNSINQTLSRTIITSGTTLIVVLSLYIFGGDVINTFAFVLLVGIVVGLLLRLLVGHLDPGGHAVATEGRRAVIRRNGGGIQYTERQTLLGAKAHGRRHHPIVAGAGVLGSGTALEREHHQPRDQSEQNQPQAAESIGALLGHLTSSRRSRP
jgi:hypothetical protein